MEFDIIKFLTTGDYWQLLVIIVTVFVAISFKSFVTASFVYIKLRLNNIIHEGCTIRMHNNTGYSDGIITGINIDFIIVEVYTCKDVDVNGISKSIKHLHHTSYIPTSKFLTNNWSVIHTGSDKPCND